MLLIGRLASAPVIVRTIGLTSNTMQRAPNIEIPDSGVLFDDMLFESGATVLDTIAAIVKRDGSVEETGPGAGVLDDPATAEGLVHQDP